MAGGNGWIATLRSVDTLIMAITTQDMTLLSRLLDVAALRQDVIAQNVANVNTPGYRTQEVAFEEALRQALSQGGNGNLIALKPDVITGSGGRTREDGNNVDVDLEMARLQKNALYFKVYAQLLAGDLAQYRSAITGH
jgi:flagellar basal-body rod protein FlgB